MPEYPGGDGSSSWIIGTLMAVLSAVVGTAVTLARMIEGKYQKQVADLEADVAALKVESRECQESRFNLAIRVASLERDTTKLIQQNTDKE